MDNGGIPSLLDHEFSSSEESNYEMKQAIRDEIEDKFGFER